MNPLESILQILQSIGTGTPQSAQQLQQQQGADQQLNQQGSLMGSTKADPRAAAQQQGPALATLNQLIQTLNPMNPDSALGGIGGGSAAVAGGVRKALPSIEEASAALMKHFLTGGGRLPLPAEAPAVGAAMSLPRMGKTITEAPTSTSGYADQLLKALTSYLDPVELSSAKNRLQPALQIAPGAPKLGENLVVGAQSAGHGPLYEALQGMPSAQMQHGYFDPSHQVFLGDALNTLLYDPERLKSATGMLSRGTSPDAMMEALGFGAPK